jgi:hypothetical protein
MLETKKNKKRYVFSALILSLILFQTLAVLSIQINDPIVRNNSPSTSLNAQSFTKDDYNSILQEVKSGLGTVSVLNILFHEKGFINDSSEFPDLSNDISQGALNVSYKGTQFQEVVLNASRNYLKNEYIDRNSISILLNDSLNVEYDNELDSDGLCGFMVYWPRLFPVEIDTIYIDNNPLESDDFTLKNNFLKFNYINYLREFSGEFSMDVVYTYNLTINQWDLTQLNANDILVRQETQNISAEYEYFFTLSGESYSGETPDAGSVSDASNLTVSLQVSPFEKDQLNNLSLSLNGQKKSQLSEYIDLNNNVNISLEDSFTANNSVFSFNFTTEFRVSFLEPITTTWAIDRLVSQANIRERIYFPSVVDGPRHLLVRFTIFEPSITQSNYRDYYSQFGRPFGLFPTPQGSLNITTPALIKGEQACPFTIKYEAENRLKIVVRDTLQMPLIGLEVRVFYHGELYGTYISKEIIQPLAPLSTNENGEINLNYLPNGNYTIKIYQYGMHQASKSVSTANEVYYMHTNILHLPVLIMIFGISSAVIFFMGVLLYLRKDKE